MTPQATWATRTANRAFWVMSVPLLGGRLGRGLCRRLGLGRRGRGRAVVRRPLGIERGGVARVVTRRRRRRGGRRRRCGGRLILRERQLRAVAAHGRVLL